MRVAKEPRVALGDADAVIDRPIERNATVPLNVASPIAVASPGPRSTVMLESARMMSPHDVIMTPAGTRLHAGAYWQARHSS